MSRRAQTTADTRQRIIDAAGRLIVEQGSMDVQIADVANAADVAVRTVYNHFTTIDELVGETMNQMTTEFLAVEPAEILPGESAVEALRRVVTDWYLSLEQHAALLDTLLVLRDSPAFTQALSKAREARRARMAALLDKANDEGALTIDLASAKALAYVLTGFAAWKAFVVEEGWATKDAGTLVAELLSSFIASDPPE